MDLEGSVRVGNGRPQLQTMTQEQTYFKSPFIWPWKAAVLTAVPLKS